MPFRQDLSRCFVDRVGAGGVDASHYERLLGQTAEALDDLRWYRESGALPVLSLPEATQDLETLGPIAERYATRFRHVVVLGTGGSTLGGQTLAALAESPFAPQPGRPRVHFLDNVDPRTFADLYAAVDLAETGFVTISKSGGTAETLTQCLTVLPRLVEAVGREGLADHILAITEPLDNPLRRIADRLGLQVLPHDPKVGGRFSVLSLVGVLPAMIAGVDVAAVRAGAAEALAANLGTDDPTTSPAAQGAALAVAAAAGGRGLSVLMPYADRLASFGLWYRQLWAESLGKQGKGTTPVRAMGTVDQHSQLQLYLDGPPDKLFTVLTVDHAGSGDRVPKDLAGDPALAYLADRRMGDVIDAEQRATMETIAGRGHPVRHLHVPTIDARALGALLMHYMLETMIAARLWEVNAFDQPAVEDGKVLTREYLAAIGAAEQGVD